MEIPYKGNKIYLLVRMESHTSRRNRWATTRTVLFIGAVQISDVDKSKAALGTSCLDLQTLNTKIFCKIPL